jgi:hypothetical protein
MTNPCKYKVDATAKSRIFKFNAKDKLCNSLILLDPEAEQAVLGGNFLRLQGQKLPGGL